MKKRIIILSAALLLCVIAGCNTGTGIKQPLMTVAVQTPTSNSPQQADETEESGIVTAYDIGQDEKPDYLAGAENDGSLGGHIPYNQYTPMYSDALLAALSGPDLHDAVFDVWVLIAFDERVYYIDINESFEYEGLTVDQWHDEYITCLRAREAYKMQLHSKLDNVPYFDKWSGSSEEATALEAEWDAEWERMWLQEHPGQLYPMTTYEDAKSALRLLLDEARSEFYEAEINWYVSAGITLAEVEDDMLYSVRLTREQALNFPLSENAFTFTMLFAYEEKWSFDNYFGKEEAVDGEPVTNE